MLINRILVAVLAALMGLTVGVPSGSALEAPSRTAEPSHWRAISGEGGSICGIKVDKTGWCWGYNRYGSLGTGAKVRRLAPTPLAGKWKSIQASSLMSCGVQTDGSGWCWGWDSSGEMGNGKGVREELRPHRLPGRDWTSIHHQGGSVCGLKEDDSLWCWGFNYDGRAGVGSTKRVIHVPTQIPGSWKKLTMVTGTNCAIATNGSAWCWGNGGQGLLGNGSFEDADSPLQVPGTWVEIVGPAGGGSGLCGRRTDGTVWCWGLRQGEADTLPFQAVPNELPGTWETLPALCGINEGAFACIYWKQVAEPAPGEQRFVINTYLPGVDDVFSETDGTDDYYFDPDRTDNGTPKAYFNHCTLKGERLGCWGPNSKGQLGNGTTTKTAAPDFLPGRWRSVDISGRSGFSGGGAGPTVCAIDTKGLGYCWGANPDGQVGVRSNEHHFTTPQLLP